MKKKVATKNNNVIIYQTKSGALEFKGDFRNETVWATLDQIASIFGRDKSVISRHLKSIFNEQELDKNSVVAKNATTIPKNTIKAGSIMADNPSAAVITSSA